MTAIAVTGYSAYWIGQIARRYNTNGPDGVRDRRHTTCAGQPDSRHVQADPRVQADFKQLLRLLLREGFFASLPGPTVMPCVTSKPHSEPAISPPDRPSAGHAGHAA